MLSKEDNEILTRVGPGTPMGGLLRLVEESCPHRGASLFYGRNEECGLRCVYHGWKFDVTGQCVDQRSELKPFAHRHRIKITSYPVRESGGIVWTYMGPAETMTPFRDFGTESLPAEDVGVVRETVYCNWVQSMDGDLDTAHISNLHQFDAIDDVPDDGSDKPGYPSIISAIPFSTRQIFVVPVDDHTTYRYNYTAQPPQNPRGLGGPPFFTYEKYPFEMMRTSGGGPTGDMPRNYTRRNDYGIDRVAQKGISYTGIPDFRSQDNMATETAGPVYDRRREHLGSTDVAVIHRPRIRQFTRDVLLLFLG
jgi:nitrite reductase/ring-hydroxylating ferredoxin subunit